MIYKAPMSIKNQGVYGSLSHDSNKELTPTQYHIKFDKLSVLTKQNTTMPNAGKKPSYNPYISDSSKYEQPIHE